MVPQDDKMIMQLHKDNKTTKSLLKDYENKKQAGVIIRLMRQDGENFKIEKEIIMSGIKKVSINFS